MQDAETLKQRLFGNPNKEVYITFSPKQQRSGIHLINNDGYANTIINNTTHSEDPQAYLTSINDLERQLQGTHVHIRRDVQTHSKYTKKLLCFSWNTWQQHEPDHYEQQMSLSDAINYLRTPRSADPNDDNFSLDKSLVLDERSLVLVDDDTIHLDLEIEKYSYQAHVHRTIKTAISTQRPLREYR